jgi:4-hydroxy-tetrahydrodipicolinate synthase
MLLCSALIGRAPIPRPENELAKAPGLADGWRTKAWTMFEGTYTAIVTPFRKGELDEPALQSLIRNQIRAGVDGIVPVGTTGESPTLSVEEHIRVVELCVKTAAGRIRVLAGTGANATAEAIHLTTAAERAGADGSLQVCPYYNKPSQEGLFQHFQAIARKTRLPLVLYSIPGRCGIEIGVETVRRLAAACRNIVGIKEAGGNVDRVTQLRAACGPSFTILSGDDALTLPFLAAGADGVISVASNLVPRAVAQMVRAFREGRISAAQRLHVRYHPVFRDLFLETNPAPIKAALAMTGAIQEELRLPLVPMAEATRARLRATLQQAGVLKNR